LRNVINFHRTLNAPSFGFLFILSFTGLKLESTVADETNTDQAKVVLSYAPSEKETRAWYLDLAGDNPDRRLAVIHWLDGYDALTGGGFIELVASTIEDQFVTIRSEYMELSSKDLKHLKLFPEITSLEFKYSPLSNEILAIIEKHKTLESLCIYGDSSIDNRICDVVAKLPNLWRVVIDSSKIDDLGLKRLVEQRRLKVLSLCNARITSQSLKYLVACNELTTVFLAGCSIQDDGLIHIAEFPDLKCLCLENTNITDNGIKHLQEIQNLAYLNVGGTVVTDQSAEVLKGLKRLAHLFLNDTQITNKTIAILPNLPKLGELNLQNTAIDDQCIPDIKKIARLKNLDIRGTNISRSGAKRIQAGMKYSIKNDHGSFPTKTQLDQAGK